MERVRHCWRVTAVDPVLHEYSFSSQLVKCQRKKNEHGRESHMFQHLLFHVNSNSTFETVAQRRTQPSRRTRWRTNGNNVDELGGNNLPTISNKWSLQHVFGVFVVLFMFVCLNAACFKLQFCRETIFAAPKNRVFFFFFHFGVKKTTPGP